MYDRHSDKPESPSPREIREACRAIQQGWSASDRRRREVMRSIRLPVLEYFCRTDTCRTDVWESRRVR